MRDQYPSYQVSRLLPTMVNMTCQKLRKSRQISRVHYYLLLDKDFQFKRDVVVKDYGIIDPHLHNQIINIVL